MSEKLFKKTRLLLMVVAISLVAMAVLLSDMQDDLSRESYRTEIEQEIKELPGLLEAAEDESAENAEQFDAIYQSKADQLAFIAQNNVGFEATDAKMVEYQELLGVENVLVVDQEGKVAAGVDVSISATNHALDRAKLQELANVLQIKHVFVFNDQGVMTGTNSSYTNFTLSEDPEDQSYEFRKLLQGVEYLVQEPMPEEVSGRVRRASSTISSRACSSSSRASSAWATSSR